MDERVDIRVAGRESIDRLRDLWISLSRHHAAVAPELEEVFGPGVTAARGIGQFTVSVIASNADAVHFYERLGLTPFLVTYAGRVSG